METAEQIELREIMLFEISRLKGNIKRGNRGAIVVDVKIMERCLPILNDYSLFEVDCTRAVREILNDIINAAKQDNRAECKKHFLQLHKILTEKFKLE